MGPIVLWAAAALIVAQGLGPGAPAMVDDGGSSRQPAAIGVQPVAQSAASDDEPLDAGLDEPPATEEPAPNDEEPLDEPVAEPDDEELDEGVGTKPDESDLEPLDRGAPLAAASAPERAPAAEPAPAPAPAAAAAPAPPPAEAAQPAYEPEPTFYPEPTYDPEPVSNPESTSDPKPTFHPEPAHQPKPASYPAPVWPFDDGGVFVNAGFAPNVEFPFTGGFDTCEEQVRLGRAYVGVGCDGADVTVGHLPPPGSERDDGPSVVRMPSSRSVSSSPARAPVFTLTEAEVEPGARRRGAASTTSRTRGDAPTRVVRGESRTTTTTTIVNRDGIDEVDEAQGADNQSAIGRGGRNGGKDDRNRQKDTRKQANRDEKHQARQNGRDETTSDETQRADTDDGDTNQDNHGKRTDK